MRKFMSLNCIVVGLFALGLTAVAMATTPPSTGLGQAWPNAKDVSLSPHYHVYVFQRDGIRYIQVNDSNGTVRGAIATANAVTIVLPVGVDAAYVKTLHVLADDATKTSGEGRSEMIYHDKVMTIRVTPLENGELQIAAMLPLFCDDAGECSNIVSKP